VDVWVVMWICLHKKDTKEEKSSSRVGFLSSCMGVATHPLGTCLGLCDKAPATPRNYEPHLRERAPKPEPSLLPSPAAILGNSHHRATIEWNTRCS